MPMYEYCCCECGLVFEVRQKFSDPPVTSCTACGAKVKKLISQGGFALKGGGWYDQGYSSAGSATKAAPACSSSGCGGCTKGS